jgi:hypothetical protein
MLAPFWPPALALAAFVPGAREAAALVVGLFAIALPPPAALEDQAATISPLRIC